MLKTCDHFSAGVEGGDFGTQQMELLLALVLPGLEAAEFCDKLPRGVLSGIIHGWGAVAVGFGLLGVVWQSVCSCLRAGAHHVQQRAPACKRIFSSGFTI